MKYLLLIILAFTLFNCCPVKVGDQVKRGKVVGIKSLAAGTKNCICTVQYPDGSFSDWDYAWKFIN